MRFRSFKQASARRLALIDLSAIRALSAEEEAELRTAEAFVEDWLNSRQPLPLAALERLEGEARRLAGDGQ